MTYQDSDQGDHSPFHESQAWAIECYEQQDWLGTIDAVEQAMIEAPLSDAAWLAVADAYSRVGLHELSSTAIEHLLTKPRLPQPWYASLYLAAKRALRTDLALAACRTAARFYPDDDEACFAMANQMAELGYSASSIAAVLQRAVNLAPEKNNYRVSLALQHCRTGNWSAGYHELQTVPAAYLRTLTCRCSAAVLHKCCVREGDQSRAESLAAVMDSGR